MNIRIKRVDKDLPLPEYHTKGAAAFDIYAREDMTIEPQSLGRVPTNLVIETPAGYFLAVVPRSSTAKKKGLLIPHGIGIIDSDYAGDSDEILYQVYNFTDQPVDVTRGERIGQAVFLKYEQAEWQEVDTMDNEDRGGFGSTGQ